MKYAEIIIDIFDKWLACATIEICNFFFSYLCDAVLSHHLSVKKKSIVLIDTWKTISSSVKIVSLHVFNKYTLFIDTVKMKNRNICTRNNEINHAKMILNSLCTRAAHQRIGNVHWFNMKTAVHLLLDIFHTRQYQSHNYSQKSICYVYAGWVFI